MNVSVDGEEWNQWYPLENFGTLRAGSRLGSIHLNMKIGPVVDIRDTSSKMFADMERNQFDRGDEDEGYAEQPPNFLRITLHQV